MKRVGVILLLLLLVCGGWFLLMPANVSAQNKPGSEQVNPEYAAILTNAPPLGFATRLDYVKSFTTEKQILKAYHAELLNQGEAMIALHGLGGKASMDTYGKVIDQIGQPVVGAKVRASVNVSGDFLEHFTKTDAGGRFSFLGLHGKTLIILPQKEGYDYDLNLPSERPNGYLPDPNNPLVFTMCKLHGGEPMKHFKIYSHVPCDGSIGGFDLLTGKENLEGDLMVKLTRNPIIINPRRPFDWSVTLGITNGGLQEVTNIYPNEAPADGYQSAVTLAFPTNMVAWKKEFRKNYYFKAKGGQTYGRIAIEILADSTKPPTYFNAEIYANPAASRNLEFDPQKKIY